MKASTSQMRREFRPLPTVYHGVEYRSRMEARWALFMDLLEIRFEYEPEAYHLSNGENYLPDFYLHFDKAWLEIKNPLARRQDEPKLIGLAADSGLKVYVFQCGPRVAGTPPDLVVPEAEVFFSDGWDDCHRWAECPKCRKIGFAFSGWAGRTACSCSVERSDCSQTRRLLDAFGIAAGWRFEE